MFEFQGTNYIIKINSVIVLDKLNEQVSPRNPFFLHA